MSITAYKVEAVGHDRTGEDYGYVNIMYRYASIPLAEPGVPAGRDEAHLRAHGRCTAPASFR